MQLKRTVPFIAYSNDQIQKTFLIDNIELKTYNFQKNVLDVRLKQSLCLGDVNKKILRSEEAEQLVLNQYETCLEFIYSHPFWDGIRKGEKKLTYSFLLECRHYLAAATFRMSQGIKTGLKADQLREHLAQHVIEESNHNQFFENSLVAMGCPIDAITSSRPLPTTVEWIHLMRTLSAYDPLSAALCSGLLEHTAKNKTSVTRWHEMLLEQEQLSKAAVQAIFAHVRVDFELGHGENWREVLRILGHVEVERLADAMNSVSLVAEMMVRWLDSLKNGLSSYIVTAMPKVKVNKSNDVLSYDSSALPIWPSEILGQMTHGNNSINENVKHVVAIAYAFSGKTSDCDSHNNITHAATDFACKLLKTELLVTGTTDSIQKIYKQWFGAINGHWLWQEMMTKPTYSLICGWLLENYHYISAISQHTGLAIGSCTDPVIRQLLVKHLKEELGHGDILKAPLEKTQYGNCTASRPLATTVAFVGALSNLAHRDWKAYCVALCYLQMSAPQKEEGNLDNFYQAITKKAPETKDLLAAMQKHDQIDSGLEHYSDAIEILDALTSRHTITDETMQVASLIAQLSWSFLDGILHHYSQGDMAVIQRIGWHTGIIN